MSAKGPRFADAHGDRPTEERAHRYYPGRSAMGRSTVVIDCPFCHGEIEAFVWSLCGGGKRCTCGALHSGRGTSLHWADATKEAAAS